MSAQLALSTLLASTTATADDVEASLYDLAAKFGLNTTSWQPGDPMRTLIKICANIIAPAVQFTGTVTESGFSTTAQSGWLTLLANLVYGVQRTEATYASGDITINNTAGGVYSFQPGDMVLRSTVARTDGTYPTYHNRDAISIPATGDASLPLTAFFIADDPGSLGFADIGKITVVVTPASLLGVVVTNAAQFVGDDAESDADVQAAIDLAPQGWSPNGPTGAYEVAAKNTTWNQSVNVTRVLKLPPPGDGTITIVVASDTGAIADVSTIQTAIDQHATPDVVTATVVSATNHDVTADLGMTVYVDAAQGLLDSDWQGIAQAAISAWIPTLPIGGVVLPGASYGIVPFRQAEGIVVKAHAGIIEAVVTEIDLALGAEEVATVGTVAVTVKQVTL